MDSHAKKFTVLFVALVFLGLVPTGCRRPAEQRYTLTTAVQGEGTISPSAGAHVYNEGQAVSVSATPAAGWRFDQWTGDLSGAVNPASITMDEDKGVTAVFTPSAVMVPDVVDMSEATASGVILSSGFVVGAVRESPSDVVPAGNVQGQNPAAGALRPLGAAIDLEISSGPALAAAFFALPATGPAPLQVRFQHADPVVAARVVSWAWDFDDDGIADSTESNPTFVYDEAGTYAVTLTVGDVAGDAITHNDPEAVLVRAPVDVVLRPNVIVVDNEPDLAFVSQTETELVLELLNGAANFIAPHDIVVGSDDGGYARVVQSVVEAYPVLTMATAIAPLTSIFEQADISGPIIFTPEDMEKAGFTITEDGRAHKGFADFEIHAGITISGGIEFNPALDLDARLGWGGVDYLRCVFVGALTMDFRTSIGVEGGLTLAEKERTLARVSKESWYLVGKVPVLIRSEFDIKAGVEAGIEGSLSLDAGYSSTTTVRLGVEYDRHDPARWRLVHGIGLNANRYGPDFNFDDGGYAKVYLKPEGRLRIYRVLGPGASIMPYLKGEMQMLPSPELALKAGIDAEVSFSLLDLSNIGLFDVGFTGRFEGPVYVLGRRPMLPPAERPASPAFDASPLSGTAPLTVAFTDRSNPGDGTITRWHWRFGDGRTGTTQHPVHTFSSPGTYQVRLTVAGTSGAVDWAASRHIRVSPPPTLPVIRSFAINNGAPATSSRAVVLNSVCVGAPTHFKASESPGFPGVAWQVYSPGVYFLLSPGNGTKTVHFKVRNASGASDAAVDTITLNEGTGPNELTILLPGDVPLVMVRIPSGTFQMGSPDTERSRDGDEGPVRTVNIGYDFYLGKYEVTQAQWLAVMGSWPGTAPIPEWGLGDHHPAYQVSWHDARNFITALNAHIVATHQGAGTMRLPSEAEWEYACRAGTQTRFSFGDSLGVDDGCQDDGLLSRYMWYCGNNSPQGSKPVGGLRPNAFGLYDMRGNVLEWCEDDWHGSYVGAPTDGSAWVRSLRASRRMIRGGSWRYGAWSCRSANRSYGSPSIRGVNVGFRLASGR